MSYYTLRDVRQAPQLHKINDKPKAFSKNDFGDGTTTRLCSPNISGPRYVLQHTTKLARVNQLVKLKQQTHCDKLYKCAKY